MHQRTLFALPPDQPPDICASKHGGSPESEDAFARVAPSLPEARARVLAVIRARGERGATAKEVAAVLGVALHKVSGRCSELKAEGKIQKKGTERRDGGAVLVTTEVGE